MSADDEHIKHINRLEELIRLMQEPMGKVALEFAHLEDRTTLATMLLMRLEIREASLLQVLMRDFNTRIRLFRALIELNVKDENLRKLGERVASLMGQANSDRNNLLHDKWETYSSETDSLNKARLEVGDHGELKQLPVHGITVPLVEETVNFIKRVGLALADWTDRFRYQELRKRPELAHPPLPDKFYEGSPLRTHMKGRKTE
jgi:hypothetical protein